MKYLSAICLSAAITLGSNVAVRAQGDSDPGLSTMGAMRTASDLMIADDEYEGDRLHIGVGNTFAKGDANTKLFIPQVEVRIPWQGYGYFDVKLPYYVAVGDVASVSGLGDFMASYTHVIRPEYQMDWSYQLTAGGRIGLGHATQQDGGQRSLPMIYQSSTGTTDLFIGANANFRNFFTVAVGYQQPILRYNDNAYDGRALDNDRMYSSRNYAVASRLYRYGDVMMRLEGSWTGRRAGLSGGPLMFYHLHNDFYTDRMDREIEIGRSRGFTMNAVGNAFIRFGRYAEMKLDVTAALPLIRREVAPDGLRRDYVIMPRFTYFFGQSTLLW